jgi:hypothetical protein
MNRNIIDFYMYIGEKYKENIRPRDQIEIDNNIYLSFINNHDVLSDTATIERHTDNNKVRHYDIDISTIDFYTNLVLFFEGHTLLDISSNKKYFL